MSRVQVDLAQLAELVDRMAALGRHLARAHAEADDRVTRLHGSWTGEAAALQAAAHAQWSRGAAEAQQALAELRATAGTAHANYCAAMLANRRMWSG